MTTSPDLPTLANDLRLACQRIARRVRFEGTADVAPHQFSVLVRVSKGAQTPTELAAVERVTTPSMNRTINGLVELFPDLAQLPQHALFNGLEVVTGFEIGHGRLRGGEARTLSNALQHRQQVAV